MKMGDRIRLTGKPVCQRLGVPAGQVGVVKDVDATFLRTAVLISFPDVDIYTSALCDEDIEIVTSASPAKPCAHRD